MNECMHASRRETVPVFLSLCDIPHHSVTFVEGFVKLTLHGSLSLPPWGQDCNWVGCPQSWDERGLGRLCFEQLDSSMLHFFEQGFEKRGSISGALTCLWIKELAKTGGR